MKNIRYHISRKISFALLFFLPVLSSGQEIIMTPSYYAGGYNIGCHGGNDGSINIVIVDGAAPFLFNWSNGSFAKNQSGLTAGTYTVIVTDVNGNTFSNSIDLSEPKLLEVSLYPVVREGGYNISENGGHDGVIDVGIKGGVSPYTYLWTGGSTEERLGELTAGTYSVIVTGTNNCSASASVTLTEPTELQIISITSPTHNGFNISCSDAKDGEITLTVTGGTGNYTYQWSNGSFTKDLNELDPGNYSVIVRDEAGVAEAGQITLTGPSPMEAQLTATVFPNGKNISCYGCANGHISTIIAGGAAPYTYLWNDGATTINRNGLIAGGYNVQITDANGCRSEAGVNIQGPEREDWTMMGNTGTDPATNFFGTVDNKDMVLKTNNIERLRIKSDGIIEANALLKMDSASVDSFRTAFVDQNGILRTAKPDPGGTVCFQPTSHWLSNPCGSNPNDIISYPISGRVGIGTTHMPTSGAGYGYKLYVADGILTEKLVIAVDGSAQWPDYVFSEDYKLMELKDLENYISLNKHLPGMQSASELSNGVDILEVQKSQMKLIEELVLYTIQLKKQNDKLYELISNPKQ
jgi:hypothetical protein